MNRWRAAPLTALVAIAVFVAIQLATPIARFGNPEVTARFGWQMFAGFVPAPQFTVVTAQGDRPVALDDYMAWPRADIDIARYLPAHLCAVVPGVVSVEWETGRLEC